MATPILTRLELPGVLGDILVDVRTGDRRSDRPAVIILPGFKGFRDFGPFPALAERLARAGFTSVAVSVSGSGVDAGGEFTRLERFAANTISAELGDLGVLLDALDSGALGVARPRTVGLVGHSRGGGVGLLFALGAPRIAALATWAATGTLVRWTPEQAREWRRLGRTEVLNGRTGQLLPLGTDLLDDVEANLDRFDLSGAAGKLTIPWLLAHGTADETVPIAEGRRLAEAARAPLTTLWLDGALHAFGSTHPFAGMTPHLSALFGATLDHFTRHLG